MAVQLTEFCPPRRRNERTNELPRGIRNYFSQSNEQDAKLVPSPLYSREYISFFLFFLQDLEKDLLPSRESMRESEREREREAQSFSKLSLFSNILNETVENRSGRLFLAMNACPSGRIYLKRRLQSLSLGKFNLFAVKKKGNGSFSKEIFVSLFFLFTANQGELRSSFEEKEKKKDLLSPFSPLRLSPAR